MRAPGRVRSPAGGGLEPGVADPLRAREQLHRSSAEADQPARQRARGPDAQGAGQDRRVLVPGQRLVVADVVDAGRKRPGRQSPDDRRHGSRRVLLGERGPVRLRRSRQRRPASARGGEHRREEGVRTVEAGEAQRNAAAPGRGEAGGGALGVQNRAVVGRRARGADSSIQSLPRPRRSVRTTPGRSRGPRPRAGFGQDRRPVTADPVVLAPGAGQEHLPGRRGDVRGEVDDDLGLRTLDRAERGGGVEQIHGDGPGPHRLEPRPLRRIAPDRRDAMPPRHQDRNRPPPDHAGGAGDEDRSAGRGGVRKGL